MFSNMRVGLRLALGFSLVLAFLVAIIGFSIYQTNTVAAGMDQIVTLDHHRIQLLHDMNDVSRETAISVRDVLLTANDATPGAILADYRAGLVEHRARYDESVARLTRLVARGDAETTDALRRLAGLAVVARQNQDHVLALMAAGRRAEGIAFMLGTSYPSVRRWISATTALITASEARLALRYVQAHEAARRGLLILILLGASAILSSVLIVITLSLSVTRPLTLTVSAVNAIASGALTTDLPSTTSRADEVGALARAFSAMVAALTETRGVVARETAERARLDALVRAASIYTRNLIEVSLDPLMTISPEGRITDVNAATREVTGASQERLIGSPFSDYFTEPEKARAGYELAFARDTVRDYPLTIRHASGRNTGVLLNANVYRDEAGKVQGVLVVAHDVTESRRLKAELVRLDWLKTGLVRLNDVMTGDPDLTTLASQAISELTTYVGAHVGVVYVAQEDAGDSLLLAGSYACTKGETRSSMFKIGEGLVGQAALEKKPILVQNVPEDYITVASGLGERSPRSILVSPFLYENRVKGVVEVGTLAEVTDQQMEYLKQSMPVLALAVENALGRARLAHTLSDSQALAVKLQEQQDDLRASNEQLREQTGALRLSEETMKAQQEQLRVTNEELVEKHNLLTRQKSDGDDARRDIRKQAEELALVSRYKSEFLANMSHELRTPLNSLLLLAQSLSENNSGNLTVEQVESAKIIHDSGGDLLNLINEVLDLSKIEAGRMDLQLDTVRIGDLADGMRASFRHMTKAKGLELVIAVHEEAPAEIASDRSRIDQIIRNLMSNAIKFTDTGSVTVTFARPSPGTDLSRSGIPAGGGLAIAVKDTGIGIAQEDQRIIFKAFQQMDGGTARKYGGTGLGLSISRELARLLGGEIQLESESGRGSTFTLYLPPAVTAGLKVAPGDTATVTVDRADKGARPDAMRRSAAAAQISDDRDNLKNGDSVILVIEDDPDFGRILRRKCHAKGFKCLAAATGEAGLELAAKHLPSAVLLSIDLPGMDGWTVLDALKEDTSTRHIPVHIVSEEGTSTESRRRGAVGLATKPVSPEALDQAFRSLDQISAGWPKRVLVVEDDPTIRRETVNLIADADVRVDEVETGEQALQALRPGGYDCVVLDPALPDLNGAKLLGMLVSEGVPLPPVVVHTARELTREEEAAIRECADSVVVKGVRSHERLLDEVSLFLHRVVSRMPEEKRKAILALHDIHALPRDKKVLIVDDDMRTTFAMSHFLSERGMNTLKAEHGERALRLLEEQPNVDLVLMDIMMPVMDGYETIRRIRDQERFRTLPIIALTAKAMPEDREKCLAAGADDYLPKPVDQARLVSMMHVWLSK